ncbi:MAG: PilZ domain-containing protein [Candidatus Krumholzibacteria bacterium]|nr:PilZ domain-containing protein [Candidatus Krumholzibacteria bacterium]MDH4337126.1 PilZ domain-containing protein [Candidatus Krumholzibacteria bacterium]MDH5271187.1 PilZ domain-containing protein [Candidatus Krumholzibacteria bacterium]
MTHAERRAASRVNARLAMEITLGDGRAKAESLNVSANGVYFASSRFIAPLTRLRITLELPNESGGKARVACDGVVVRTEPEAELAGTGEYEVACYFTEISEPDKSRLEKYILAHVPF